MILVVAMAMEEAIKIYTLIFIVLSGNDHSVKVSSNSEMGPGMALWDFFGYLRELVLKHDVCLSAGQIDIRYCF